MIYVALITGLSIVDAYLSGVLFVAGLGTELSPLPPWFIHSVPIRAVLALGFSIWFRSKGWEWVLWIWSLLLFGVIFWNSALFLVWNMWKA